MHLREVYCLFHFALKLAHFLSLCLFPMQRYVNLFEPTLSLHQKHTFKSVIIDIYQLLYSISFLFA